MKSSGRFLQGVCSSWVSLIIIAAVQMIQIRIARNALSTEDFATFGVISSLITTLLLVEIGARSAIIRLIIEEQKRSGSEFSRFSSNAKFILTTQAALIFASCIACVPFVEHGLSPASAITARWVMVAYGAAVAASYASGFSQLFLLANQRLALVSALGTLGTVVSFAGFYIAIRSGCGLWAYAWSSIPGLLIAMFIFPWVARRTGLSVKFRMSDVSLAELRPVFGLGFDLFFVSLYGTVLCNSFILFGKGLLGASDIAVLAVNLKLVQLSLQVFQKIPGTAEPILAQSFVDGEMGRFVKGWVFTTKFALISSIIGAGALYLAGGAVIQHWTSSADVLSGVPFALLTLIPLRYAVQCCCTLPATVTKSIHRLRMAIVVEIIVFFGLAVVLGRRFGTTGILVANFASIFAGVFFPSLRHFSEVSGRSRTSLGMVFGRACIPGLLLFGMVVFLFPHPESRSLGFVGSLLALWLVAASAAGWIFSLSKAERGDLLLRLKTS